MRLHLTRDFYIPKSPCQTATREGIEAIVYYGDTPKPWAMGFHGKQSKYDFYNTFVSSVYRDRRIEDHFAGLEAHEEFKRELKENRKETRTQDASYLTKQALIPYFGREYVHVKRGRGTGSGWIHAHVYIPRPADCFCAKLAEERAFNGFGYCESCREVRGVAQRVIDKATEGIKYGSYCADDGYNTYHREFIAEIHFGPDL